jgi:hypothetical protein
MEKTRGVTWIHSAPAALRSHVEWAIGAVLGAPVQLEWTPQPAEPGTWRAEYTWHGAPGTGAALASALRRCERARYEVTEDATAAGEGSRWAFTPRLGVFSATIGRHGDLLIPEDRIKKVILGEALGGPPLVDALADLLGSDWDSELEVFRHAGEGSPVRWLHRVG